MKNFLVLFMTCALLFLGTLAAAQSAHDARSGQAFPEAPAGAAESEATEQERSRHIEMMQALMPGEGPHGNDQVHHRSPGAAGIDEGTPGGHG